MYSSYSPGPDRPSFHTTTKDGGRDEVSQNKDEGSHDYSLSPKLHSFTSDTHAEVWQDDVDRSFKFKVKEEDDSQTQVDFQRHEVADAWVVENLYQPISKNIKSENRKGEDAPGDDRNEENYPWSYISPSLDSFKDAHLPMFPTYQFDEKEKEKELEHTVYLQGEVTRAKYLIPVCPPPPPPQHLQGETTERNWGLGVNSRVYEENFAEVSFDKVSFHEVNSQFYEVTDASDNRGYPLDESDESDVVHCTEKGCDKEFVGTWKNRNLRRHKQLNHGADSYCLVCRALGCNRTFRRADARLIHERKHPELANCAPVKRRSSSQVEDFNDHETE